jgi:hypothetical protein
MVPVQEFDFNQNARQDKVSKIKIKIKSNLKPGTSGSSLSCLLGRLRLGGSLFEASPSLKVFEVPISSKRKAGHDGACLLSQWWQEV